MIKNIDNKLKIFRNSEKETMMKSLLIMCFIISVLAFPGCTATIQVKNSLDNLSDEEIKAYNSDPNNIDKIVCTIETPIGPRIFKRVCRKESSIDEGRRLDLRTLETIQTGSTHNTYIRGGE